MDLNSEMTRNSRYGDAILSAAVAPAVLTGLFLIAQIGLNFGSGLPVVQALPGVVAVSFFALVVAFLHALVLGLPAIRFLERAGRANVFTAIAAGFAIGGLPVGLLTVSISGVSADWADVLIWLKVVGVAALCGAVGGMSAWLTLCNASPAGWRWNTALGFVTLAFAMVAAS